MSMSVFFFYFFAFLISATGLIVAFSKNLLHSAFSLFFLLFAIAGLYVLLGGDFIAVVQLMVYAGGINVLLIFGTMLTLGMSKPETSNLSFQGILSFVAGALMLGYLVFVFQGAPWPSAALGDFAPTTAGLGKLLLKEYVLPFEVISFLLVTAMVGSLMLIIHDKKQ